MKVPALWNPFREFAPFATFPEVERFFGEMPYNRFAGPYEPWLTMRMDVVETPAGFTVKMEIPGMKKEDIAVSIVGEEVTINAEVKRAVELKTGENLLRGERYYGPLTRVVTLPFAVDPAKAEATYEDGILTLTLPKMAGVETTRLPIH